MFQEDDKYADKDSGAENYSSDDENVMKKGLKRRHDDDEEDEDKKAERRAANRRSAFKSRQRRKILIDDLQKTVTNLSKDNTALRNAQKELKSKLEVGLLENQVLKKELISAAPTEAVNSMAPTHNVVSQDADSVGMTGGFGTAGPTIGTPVFPPTTESSANANSLAAARLALAGTSNGPGTACFTHGGSSMSPDALYSLGVLSQLTSGSLGPQANGAQSATPISNDFAGQLQEQISMLLRGLGQGGTHH